MKIGGLIAGLRYIAAAMMVYAVTLALGEFELYRRPWFMPGVAAVINGTAPAPAFPAASPRLPSCRIPPWNIVSRSTILW